MKHGTPVVLCLALLVSVASAQSDTERKKQAEEVQIAVEQAINNGQPKVKGVRYDVRIFEGKIVIFDDDGFSIVPEKGNSAGKLIKIKYRDVIELETKSTLLSYFPDAEQKPFGDWAAVRKLSHGESLDIDLVSKEQLFGALLKSSESDLTIMQGNEQLVVKRETIARILLARRDTPEAKKILKGAGKGAASVGQGGRGDHPHAAGAIVDAAIIAGGAVVGAVAAAATRGPNDRLLIYAK